MHIESAFRAAAPTLWVAQLGLLANKQKSEDNLRSHSLY
jgi:hypothetical protein